MSIRLSTRASRRGSAQAGGALLAASAVLAAVPAPAQAAPGPIPVPSGGVVYVTNAVSGDVSSLAIGRGGSLTSLGKPVSTGGEFPRGIALTPDGANAYVVNSDSDTLSVFRVGAQGALQPDPLIVPTGDEPWGATIAPDGRTLYVTNTADGTISMYRLGSDGTPARIGDVRTTSDSPKQTVLSPDGRFLYLSYAGADDTSDSPPRVVTRFAVRADGTLGPGEDVAKVGQADYAIAISPNGGFVYVASAEARNVWGFRRGADGSLTPVPGSPFPAPDLPVGLKVTPDGQHLYVGSNDEDTDSPPGGLLGFSIAEDGSLRPAPGSPAHTPDGAIVDAVAISPDGRNVFGSVRDTSQVAAFAIGAGGALKEAPGSPFPTGGERPLSQAIVVRPAPVSAG
ncbi:lactonase family protein [Actinomadura fibrosa]|uniref:Lactonase family protein n=1 Tax=Actinomadura fibrosa TaxID=111802 RepID=A0ABW2XVR4_9ACTN|nr:beta-propeller fold lactonase family protein [Actinomadura fibrosa]